MRGFLCKFDKGLPSYAPKTILSPFAPNSPTKPQSPCVTKFSKKKQTGKALVIKFWINWGRFGHAYVPNLYNRAQPPWGTKFLIKKSSLFYIHEILNKMRGFCVNLTRGCQVMPQKPFWAHLPQIHLQGPSPNVRLNF